MLAAGWHPEGDNTELKNSKIALNLKQAQKEFLEYHINKNSRNRTLIAFKSKTGMLVDYFGESKKITEITTVDITKMMLALEKQNKWSGVTFVNTRAAFTNFFNFLKSTGRIEKSPFDDFGEKRKMLKSESHQIFSEEHFEEIKKWLQANDPYCWFCLSALYNTSIRPAELRLLECRFVDLKNEKVTIPAQISKNKKTESVSIGGVFIDQLTKLDLSKKYLVGSTDTITGDETIGEKLIARRFGICLKALKLTNYGYTLYSIKSFSAVRKFDAGWSLYEICSSLRHSSLVETETYLRGLKRETRVNKPIPVM